MVLLPPLHVTPAEVGEVAAYFDQDIVHPGPVLQQKTWGLDKVSTCVRPAEARVFGPPEEVVDSMAKLCHCFISVKTTW